MTFVPKNDKEYKEWLNANPDAYVLTYDAPQRRAAYPMLHHASHKLIRSDEIDNYTMNEYRKVCSTKRGDLERWAEENDPRELKPCKNCQRKGLV